MQKKVEITGINTTLLKVLSNEESLKLVKESQNGDMEARERLVEGNLKLILSCIKKFVNRNENPDDLFQVGSMGLLKAINNFDFNHGVRFSTYAVPMIIGEIKRYLRDNSKIRVSRSMKDIAYKALQYKEQYTNQFYKEPTIEEIAKELSLDLIDVVIALEAIQEPVSIFTPIFSGGNDEIFLIDQIADTTNSEEKKLQKMIIEEGLRRLTPRLRNIIDDRYYNCKTQMEIAEEMGISQAQVSRLEKTALKIIFDK